MIIGIDSSGISTGITILKNGIMESFSAENSEIIPSFLKDKGIKPETITAIGITIGPGSFTALRVGLAASKGISYPFRIPIYGIDTFDGMIYPLKDNIYIPTIYARKGFVYATIIEKKGGELKILEKEGVYKVGDILNWDRGIFIGSGVEENKLAFKGKKILEGINISEGIAMIVKGIMEGKKIRNILNPVIPNYLSPSLAESKREGKGIIFRDISLDDISEILEIEKSSFSDPWDSDFFYMLIMNRDKCINMKAMKFGILVGYTLGCFEQRGFHLMNIAVKKEYRREGIAKSLLYQLIRRVEKNEKCLRIFLEVRINNESAINLYKMFGFKILEVLKGYYSNGEEAVIMELPLRSY